MGQPTRFTGNKWRLLLQVRRAVLDAERRRAEGVEKSGR